MRTIIGLFILLGLTLSACKKGKADIVLKGTITDATFNTSLTGATVKLYEVEAGGTTTNLLGTQVLGSDGAYSFTFPRNAVENYILEIRKDGYFPEDIDIPLTKLTVEEDNVRNYSTTAQSWAGLHFSTVGTGSVSYIRQAGKSGCDDCCTSSEVVLYGPMDTIIYCPNDGNTLYSYTYTAGINTGLKQVTTTAFDTAYINLNF